ncbi:MAG: lysylphosphatidylglycerol synthase domain-containing protein [Novosphingobium sp.]
MPWATLSDQIAALAAASRQRFAQWRGPIVAIALGLFLVGTVWSFLGLGLSLARINFTALIVLVVVMGFANLVYSALSLSLLAKTAGAQLAFGTALRASARAQVAEALPLPGGAMVRAATLVGAGVPAARSAVLVIGTALLWIALAAIAAGAILAASSPLAGWALLGGGTSVALASLVHVGRLGGAVNAALTLAQRVAGLGIASVRLWLSFAVIGTAMSLADTFPYVLAAIAGSASSLVPGGLGVSEALGALMAKAVHASPEGAFLAVAVNRVTQFLGTAIIAPFLEFGAGRPTRSERR